MTRDVLSRALRGKTVVLKPKPRRTELERRLSCLRWGALLTLAPALALLPVIGYLLVFPKFPHARLLGGGLLLIIAVCEFKGVPRLAHCLQGEFDILGALAFGALILLLVLLTYTGIFLVSFFFTG